MAVAESAAALGRDAELERLDAFLGGDSEGLAKLLLEGDAGIGKTTLWRAALVRARELGFRVVDSRPAAAERELSFAALGDLLGGLHDEIGGLPAPQRRALRIALALEGATGEPPDPGTIAVAVTALLRRLADGQPLLIAVDDVQWLDAPSSAALEFAIRRLNDAGVRVIATSKTNEEAPITFNADERMLIGPLSLEALGRLVRERLGAQIQRLLLRQLQEASGGNPFYALEIAASLLRSGRQLEPGEHLPIPAHLREVVRARLEMLTPDARDAALATAALAHPTVAAVQSAIGGGDAAIAEALAAGILERDGQALRFTHALFAASVYDDSPPADRKAMHKRLAQVVTDPEERARQHAEAADGPDATVAAFLEAAASSVVARGAPDAGIGLAKLAVVLTPPDRRAALHKRRLDCARYCLAAGDPKHAEELLKRQLEVSAPGRERAQVELELGRAELTTHGISAATTRYTRALEEVADTEELELQATILVELADMHLGDLLTGSDASRRALDLAEKVWNPNLLARALALHGTTLSVRGQPPAEDYWERALEIERDSGELRYGGPAYAYGDLLFSRGDLEAAEARLREVADSMRLRSDLMLPRVLLRQSDVARAAGLWDDAAGYVEEAHGIVVQTGQESIEPDCLLYEARFALLRGDLDRAKEQVDDALAALERLTTLEGRRAAFDGPMMEGFARSLLGRIAAMGGRAADAHECFRADLETLRRLGLRELLVEALVEDTGALVALGALDEASSELEEIQEIARALELPWLHALEARAHGIVAAARGDLDGALRELRRSRDLFETMDPSWVFERARTLLALGASQRRAHQKLAARRTLDQALEIFERLGAPLWAEQTRTELRQVSGRPSSPGALTATEQRVAEVVAAGCSNAEAAHQLFMSPKTVEWNLSKIYKKLHVRSRGELAAKLAQQAIQL